MSTWGRIASIAALGTVGFLGWIAGSVFPAPSALIRQLEPDALEQRAGQSLRGMHVDALQRWISTEQLQGLVQARKAAGQLIFVERDATAAPGSDAPAPIAAGADQNGPLQGEAPGGADQTAPVRTGGQLSDPTGKSLSVCPDMTVTNAPAVDSSRLVKAFAPEINVDGVHLALDPTPGACLSSGFGERGGRPHLGIDFSSPHGGEIHAGGDGVIREMKYRDDYGNMVLIDHGGGVYTRYAHLASFQKGLAVGRRVHQGDLIGLMGNTAGYPVPVHLHYEILTGDYDTPKASFGLTPHNPFEFRSAG